MPERYLSSEDKEAILKAIEQAEKNTSGEIRVHIEERCPFDPVDRAVALFNELGMYKTTLRNGVLLYVAIKDKRFAIIGDKGINEKVPENFWSGVRDIMKLHLSQGHLVKAITEGIKLAGEELKKFFPYHEKDENELSNQISFGNS